MKEFPGYCNTIIKQGNMHLTPSKFGVTSKSVPSLSKPEIYTHDYYNDPKIIIDGAY